MSVFRRVAAFTALVFLTLALMSSCLTVARVPDASEVHPVDAPGTLTLMVIGAGLLALRHRRSSSSDS